MFRSGLSRLAFGCCLIVVSATLPPASADDAREIIGPGPSTISEDERAIEADPAAGIEHGVILTYETQRDDVHGARSQVKTHVRAKILSRAGRGLADVELILGADEVLTRWWGQTLLPDGRVLRLEHEDLVMQDLARAGKRSVRAARAALPGVVPGAVIDYGYTITSGGLPRSQQIVLQKPWPVRDFYLRWIPVRYHASAYRVYRSEGLDVTANQRRQDVIVRARDLTPVAEEPWMPPEHEVRASVILYYLDGEAPKHYWKRHAKRIDAQSRSIRTGDAVDRALQAATSGDGDLDERLRRAYEWIAANVESPVFLRDEDATALPPDLAAAEPIDQLFTEVARALGAEAHVVLAPDRRSQFWDPNLLTMRQFATRMVAVRAAGAPDEAARIVDPDSGLPYGELPWWVTGVQGLLADANGARAIFLPSPDARHNLTRAIVELGYAGDGSIFEARWSSSAEGQAGRTRAEALAAQDEVALERRCGLGPEVEIVEADHRIAYPPIHSLLDCGIERPVAVVPGADLHLAAWTGPWIEPLPELPAGPRVHPVVFDFPRIDIAEVTVRPPAGFRPTTAPEPVTLTTPFGKYERRIRIEPVGYKVERALALLPLVVPPQDYPALRDFLETVRRADVEPVEFRRGGREGA